MRRMSFARSSSQDALQNKTVTELRALSSAAGVNTRGSKDTLISRLREASPDDLRPRDEHQGIEGRALCSAIPKGPCTQIVYTLAPMYLYMEYLKVNVYTI